jgi:hypothetical protein
MYGNYVVQKALRICSKKEKKNFIENIIKNIEKIKDKKINTKWKSIVESHVDDNTIRCLWDKGNKKSFTVKTTLGEIKVKKNKPNYNMHNNWINNTSVNVLGDLIQYDNNQQTPQNTNMSIPGNTDRSQNIQENTGNFNNNEYQRNKQRVNSEKNTKISSLRK